MANRLGGTLDPGTGRGNNRYDWPAWLDGDQWELVQGVDFTVSPHSFRLQAQNTARRIGRPVKTRISQDAEGRATVLMQAERIAAPIKQSSLQLPPPLHAEATYLPDEQ